MEDDGMAVSFGGYKLQQLVFEGKKSSESGHRKLSLRGIWC